MKQNITETNRNVVNISSEIYDRVKSHCQKHGYKISSFVEQSLEHLMLIQETDLRTRCLVFRGSSNDLRRLSEDPKVKINGWGGTGQIGEKNFSEVYKHSLSKSEDLLLTYIVEHVKKEYPNIKVTELDYQSFKEQDV